MCDFKKVKIIKTQGQNLWNKEMSLKSLKIHLSQGLKATI